MGKLFILGANFIQILANINPVAMTGFIAFSLRYIDLQNIPENKYYSMDQNPDEEEKL